MMPEVRAAFARFWGGFTTTTTPVATSPRRSLQAFAGMAPTGAQFPLIVFEVVRPASLQNAMTIARVVDRVPGQAGFSGRTDDILQQIDRRIGFSGFDLKIPNWGEVMLSQGNPFQQYMSVPDPDDPLIVQAVVNVEVRGRLP